MSDLRDARLALIPTLAEKAASGHIGRTALMKYMYFLQIVRSVPLGYRFTLYSYGPFDADVLADLANAEMLSAVEAKAVLYPGGYGYEIKPSSKAKWLKDRASKFLKKYKADLQWVTREFGSYSSAQLELVSTIVYVDREAADERKKIELQELARRVSEVKPHFSNARILQFAQRLSDSGLLRAVRQR